MMRFLFLLLIPVTFISCSEFPTREQTARYETYRQMILSHSSILEADTIPGGDSLIRALTSDDLAAVVRKNNFSPKQTEAYLNSLSVLTEIVQANIYMDSAMKSTANIDSLIRATDSLLKDSSAFQFKAAHK